MIFSPKSFEIFISIRFLLAFVDGLFWTLELIQFSKIIVSVITISIHDAHVILHCRIYSQWIFLDRTTCSPNKDATVRGPLNLMILESFPWRMIFIDCPIKSIARVRFDSPYQWIGNVTAVRTDRWSTGWVLEFLNHVQIVNRIQQKFRNSSIVSMARILFKQKFVFVAFE